MKNNSGGVKQYRRDVKIVRIENVAGLPEQYHPYVWIDTYIKALPPVRGENDIFWHLPLAKFNSRTGVGYTNAGKTHAPRGKLKFVFFKTDIDTAQFFVSFTLDFRLQIFCFFYM